jgi:hypothetical protein
MIYKFNGKQVTGIAAAGVAAIILGYFAVVILIFSALGYVAWEILFGGLLG